jgi:16S rRNA (guanine527-N7)-methyltransferase
MPSSDKISYTTLTACANVSRETLAKLKIFGEMIFEWNKSFNLVSRNIGFAEIWSTHIMECVQFGEVIKDYCIKEKSFSDESSYAPRVTKTDYTERLNICDIGSGAGFPGIILGIMGFKCILVERNHKKTVFLKEATRKLSIDCIIINNDIRAIPAPLADDFIITSRAVTSINNLLKICQHLINDSNALFLLKSSKQLDELDEARKYWTFELKQYHNQYRKEGTILRLNKLMRVGNEKQSENNINR